VEFEPIPHLVVYAYTTTFTMKNFGVSEPCAEKWSEMSPTEKGAFCQRCAIEVIDFSTKTASEIREILRENTGNRICGRMTLEQEAQINREFDLWQMNDKRSITRLMTLALIVVFGFSLFSCSSQEDKMAIQQIQRVVQKIDVKAPEKSSESIELAPTKVYYANIQRTNADEELKALEEDVYEDKVILKEVAIEAHVLHQEEMVTMGVVAVSQEFDHYLEQVDIEPEYDSNGRLIPDEYGAKVFPNPAFEAATYELQMPKKRKVLIALYNDMGGLVQEIYQGKLNAGTHHFDLNLIDRPAGSYYLIVRSKDFTESTQFIKL